MYLELLALISGNVPEHKTSMMMLANTMLRQQECVAEHVDKVGNQIVLCRGVRSLPQLQITVSPSHIQRAA